MFSIADLPHSPGVVYYHLLLRREIRIPGVAPFFFRIGIWDLFVHLCDGIGQQGAHLTGANTDTSFYSLWEVVDQSRSKMHETCLIIIHDHGMRPEYVIQAQVGSIYFLSQ